MKTMLRAIFRSKFLPVFILAFGFFIAFIISSTDPKPNKGIEIPKPTAVFYENPQIKDITLKVNTNGEVRSVTEINVIPQVSGRIIQVADEFIDGGNIKKGQPLIWIDDRDYKLASISAESRVAQAKKLLETGVTGIAYETVTAIDGSLPLLAPMSAIAGQLSMVVGSYHLLKPNHGRGTLISNIDPRIVTIIGAGVAGREAIAKAIANDAKVKVIDLDESVLNDLQKKHGKQNIEYILSTPDSVHDALRTSDLVIGSVYVVGKEAPKVVKKEMLKDMVDGSVLVDISIDQGGCFETSKPTNHDDPTFIHDGILHYCVTNMPGAVPLTASNALNKATLPFIIELAEKGISKAIAENENLNNGLNIKNGEIIHPGVKESLLG